MAAVTRLVTFVDVREEASDERQTSVSARHEAELDDGRRVPLLDDRGWTSSTVRAGRGASSRTQLDPWFLVSAEEIEETARFVVGPDEPFEGRSQDEMEATHWAYLADVLRQQGVVVAADDLKRLPHDVVLGERLQSRIGRGRDGTATS